MAKPIKYSDSIPSGAIKKGNVSVGVGTEGYGPTSVTGWYAGASPSDYYQIYETTNPGEPPVIYSPTNEDELIRLVNSKGGSVSNEATALQWINTQPNLFINDDIDSTVTDGLIAHLDASVISSYPTIGSTWYDLSGNDNNAVLSSGVSYSNDKLIFNNSYSGNIRSLIDYNNLINNDFTIVLSGKKTTYGNSGNNVGNSTLFQGSGNGWNGGWRIVEENTGATGSVFSSPHRISFSSPGTGGSLSNKTVQDTIYRPFFYAFSLSGSMGTAFLNSNINSEPHTYSGGVQTSQGYISYTGAGVGAWGGNIQSMKVYNKGLSLNEINQLYYKGNIVTNNLVFAIDPSNTPSYESGSTAVNSLTGSVASTLINGTKYSSDNGGVWEYGSSRNTSTILGNNYSVGPFDLPAWDGHTIGVWVKRTGYGTWQSGTTNYDGIWNYYWNYHLEFSGAHTGVNAFTGNGFTSYYYINFDEWYYVVMSHDNITGRHRIYINGQKEYDLYSGNPTHNNGNPRQFYLGNWDQGWSMVGQIGGFHIYDKELSSEEVLQNYNAHKSRFPNKLENIQTSGQWLKVFRQYSKNGDFFSSDNGWAEAKRVNEGNPNANKYSILDRVADYQIDGKYTFKLVYPQSGLTNIWSQTNNPVTDDGNGGVTGYEPISIDMTSNGWGGLERYDATNSTFLDGTLSPISNWYYAIGSKSWGSATTFPGHSPAVDEVELWIKYV